MAAKRPELLAGERKEGETDRAVQACNDYLRMGPGRSLSKLIKKGTKRNQKEPITDSESTLKKWSADFDWQSRSSAYDAKSDAEKTQKRRLVMEQGLALDYERVTKLKRLARFLELQIFVSDSDASTDNDSSDTEYPHVWLQDVKQIGSGDSAERVDLVRFNAAILAEYRAALDDIAAETGGRAKKIDHTIKNIDYGKLSVEQLIRIKNGESELDVILSEYISSEG